MDKSASQAEALQTLENFTVAVNEEFVSQGSPGLIKWSTIQKLVKILKKVRIKPITSESHQLVFINNLVNFFELVMGFLSDDKNMEYRKQIHYAVYAMDFIPDMFVTLQLRNNFVKHATVNLMSLFMYGRYNLVSKKSLITTYNLIAAKTEKSVRIRLAESVCDIMYQLLDCLSIQGDYALQADILETVFRIFGNEVKFKPENRHLLVPNSLELSEALANDFSVHNFDIDVRNWLEKFNKDSQNVFSIGCKRVIYGSYECEIPEEFDVMWVDFNLKDNMLCLCHKETDAWNRITVPSSYVKKTKVKRPLGANESTISFYLSKPCVSSQNQKFWDELDKHLKLIISNKEKDKINRLVTQVLPQAFGDSFEHGSEKILKHPRPVYKPLGIKISKKKSDAMSASSVSKSRSEAASTVEANSPVGAPDEKVSVPVSPQSACRSDEGSVIEPKMSFVNPNRAVGSDISSAITDFTRMPRYGAPGASLNGVVTICSNNSDVFPSNGGSVEGSGDGDDGSCRFGRSSGAANQTAIQEASEFQRSEIRSSSPLKISKQKEDPDLSSELYFSPHSGDEEEHEESHQHTKVSAVQSQEDLFTENFETAQEEFAEAVKISQYCEPLPLQKERKTDKKQSKIEEKIIGTGDTKWTSRLRSRTTKTTAEEKRLNAVEDVLSDEPSDIEDDAQEVIKKPKEIDKEILTEVFSKDAAKEVITKPKETVKEILTEVFSEDTAQEVITKPKETVKERPIEAFSEEVAQEDEQFDDGETQVAPVASDDGLLTEDLEVIVIDSQPTQQVIQDSQLSLLVNVGTVDSQYSEEIVKKTDVERGVPRLGKQGPEKNKDDKLDRCQIEEYEPVTKDDTDGGKTVLLEKESTALKVTDDTLEKSPIQKSKRTKEEELQVVIDLTLDDSEKTSTQNDVRVAAEEAAPMFNTPELLVILQPAVRETQTTEKKGTTKQTEEASIVETNEEVVNKKWKKGRTLIPTGKKRFDLEALISSQAEADRLDVAEKKIRKKDTVAETSRNFKEDNQEITDGVACVAVEEGVKKVIDSETHRFGNEKELVNDIPEENLPSVGQKEKQEHTKKKDTAKEKEVSVAHPKALKKNKRGKTFVKRGIKRLNVKKLPSSESDNDTLDVVKLKIQKKAEIKTDSCEKDTVAVTSHNFEEDNREKIDGVACGAVEEGVINVIDSETDIFGNEKEILNNSPKEIVSIENQKDLDSPMQRSSSPSEMLAPEINASNIDYLKKFDELKEEENSKSAVSAPLDKSETFESIEEPKDIKVKEETDGPRLSEDKSFKYSSVKKKGKSNNDRKKLMADKSVELENYELFLENQGIIQNNEPKTNIDVLEKKVTPKKILAAKTPDTSPDQPPQVLMTTAQIHQEQKPVKKSEQPLKKKDSFEKRDQGDLDVIAVDSSAPTFVRTRSSERIRSRRLSPEVVNAPSAITSSRNAANASTSSRRLFDPANLDYLDQMPALAEQPTPEYTVSPIAPPINNKLPEKKRKTTKKRAQADPESFKPKKEPKKAKDQAEKQKKPAKKIRGKRNFEFSTLDFKSLDELFNKSCAGIATRTGYDGFNTFNATSFKPLTVRAAPIDTSSDESPKVLSSMLNKNVPNRKYTPDKVGSSSDFSWPELEIERGNQTKKIRILQDIVIKPKRPQPEQIEPPKSAKRKKLDFDEVPHVPVPAVPMDDDRAIEAEMAAIPHQPIVPYVPDDRLMVPRYSRSPREALQSDQYSAALPENMEHIVAQDDTVRKGYDEAILVLKQIMNPVVLEGLQRIINHKEEIWQLLQSH